MSNDDREDLMATMSRRFSTPPASTPPTVLPATIPQKPKPQPRQAEAAPVIQEEKAGQETVYIYPSDLYEVDSLHYDLAKYLMEEGRRMGKKKRRSLQKYETWRSVVRVALQHPDEIRAHIIQNHQF